ncbi:putative toxin-antitoxin system toxin component, PIN family [Algoriphagus algorifonticola]|uniref:putative toxin-antitoxin system toxin component, PIN family n=1 Tax=Algoriphagus algorifonticola TaxID=2593007 RepID=UPI001642F2FD
MRVVLDTNVLISALISRSYPSKVLEAIFSDQEIELCLSEEIFTEYTEVLARPKFSKFKEFYISANFVLQQLSISAKFFTPNRSIDILEDKSDNKFLELSLDCKADYLITGNFHDFNITQFRKLKFSHQKNFIC